MDSPTLPDSPSNPLPFEQTKRVELNGSQGSTGGCRSWLSPECKCWESSSDVAVGDDLGKGLFVDFLNAPNNENLDLMLGFPAKDFDWCSSFKTGVIVDAKSHARKTTVCLPLRC